MWVIGDFDTVEAVQVLKDALITMVCTILSFHFNQSPYRLFLQSKAGNYRLSFLHTPEPGSTNKPYVSLALYNLIKAKKLEKMGAGELLRLLKIISPAPTSNEDVAAADALLEELLGESSLNHSDEFAKVVLDNQLFARKMGVSLGDVALLVNGRVRRSSSPLAFNRTCLDIFLGGWTD